MLYSPIVKYHCQVTKTPDWADWPVVVAYLRRRSTQCRNPAYKLHIRSQHGPQSACVPETISEVTGLSRACRLGRLENSSEVGEQTDRQVWSAEIISRRGRPNRVTSAVGLPRHGRYTNNVGWPPPEQICSGLALCASPACLCRELCKFAPARPKDDDGVGFDYCARHKEHHQYSMS